MGPATLFFFIRPPDASSQAVRHRTRPTCPSLVKGLVVSAGQPLLLVAFVTSSTSTTPAWPLWGEGTSPDWCQNPCRPPRRCKEKQWAEHRGSITPQPDQDQSKTSWCNGKPPPRPKSCLWARPYTLTQWSVIVHSLINDAFFIYLYMFFYNVTLAYGHVYIVSRRS